MLQPAIQKTMHGFITNENNFEKYKYTYKGRRKKILHMEPEEASETNTQYIGREGT